MGKINLIESTPEYNIFEAEYEGTKRIVRFWIETEEVEMKFTNEFAVANGYKDRVTMAKEIGVYESLCAFYGWLPDWLRVNKGGEYSFQIPNYGTTLN